MGKHLQKLATSGELLLYLWRARRWWMIPVVVLLLAFGLIVAIGQSSALAPIIYTLF
jgi:Family of unknown function (DUF5989)